MKLQHAYQEFMKEIEVRKYTPKTIRGYRNNLSLFLRFCEKKVGIEDMDDVNLPVVKRFAQFMSEAGSSNSNSTSKPNRAKTGPLPYGWPSFEFCQGKG